MKKTLQITWGRIHPFSRSSKPESFLAMWNKEQAFSNGPQTTQPAGIRLQMRLLQNSRKSSVHLGQWGVPLSHKTQLYSDWCIAQHTVVHHPSILFLYPRFGIAMSSPMELHDWLFQSPQLPSGCNKERIRSKERNVTRNWPPCQYQHLKRRAHVPPRSSHWPNSKLQWPVSNHSTY